MDLDTIFDLPGILPSTALGIYGAVLESGTLVRARLLCEVRVSSAEEAASRVLHDHDKLNGVRISHYLFYRHRFNEESYDNDLRLRNILLHHGNIFAIDFQQLNHTAFVFFDFIFPLSYL